MPTYLKNCPTHGLVEAIGKDHCSECFEDTKGETRMNWNVSKADHDLIIKIIERAESLDSEIRAQRRERLMDLTACHANGCPLMLSELLAAPDYDFAHDVYGITSHIDRRTGQLKDCFLPRYAQPTACDCKEDMTKPNGGHKPNCPNAIPF